jgi:hypothetical protein
MRHDRDASISPTAGSILQIAYDPVLLEIRQIMLEKSGYRVTSALGNDNGIALVKNGQFDVVVIGFSTRLSTHEHVASTMRPEVCPFEKWFWNQRAIVFSQQKTGRMRWRYFLRRSSIS